MTNPSAAPGADPSAPIDRSCRFCGVALEHVVIDLGMSPLCESFLAADELERMEPFYPLRVRICGACLLVQLPAYVSPVAIFTEYAYFSSFSDSWVEHARRYTATMVERLDLGRTASSWSWAAMTATCSSISSIAGSASSGSTLR